jgi:hypothetical protein
MEQSGKPSPATRQLGNDKACSVFVVIWRIQILVLVASIETMWLLAIIPAAYPDLLYYCIFIQCSEPPLFPRPPYYLLNFERALAWITERYDDLLSAEERSFISDFWSTPMVHVRCLCAC